MHPERLLFQARALAPPSRFAQFAMMTTPPDHVTPPHAGGPLGAWDPSGGLEPVAPPLRIWRSRDDRVLAGVLGGFAEKHDLESRPVRIIYTLLTIGTGGLAIIPYVVYWAVARTRGAAVTPPGLWRSSSSKLVAGVLGGLARKFGMHPVVLRIGFSILTAATFVIPGVLTYLVLWSISRPDVDEWRVR
jgi:phage shock protein PspC (stress-responsive transcriptional regulator)